MKIRKGIAAIIFRKEKGKTKFLLLKRKQNWKGWEFIKGGSQKKETTLQTLMREIEEETGIYELYKIIKTPYSHSFKYQKPFVKDKIRYYGAKNKIFLINFRFDKIIWIDRKEHSGYGWFSKKEALKRITWPDQKKIFIKAIKRL